MAGQGSFSVVDYVIFGLMLAISMAIGLFYGCKNRKKPQSSKELLVAGGKMGVFPSSLSLLASFMSGVTILGNPAESYSYGFIYIWIGIAYTLVTIATSEIFIPVFMTLETTSAYEYLEKRFNSRYVKLVASCIFIFQMVFYMALVLYAPALALNQVTGLNTWISVISIGIVCTVYTTIGGMKAVMWTDVFQIGIMFTGLLAALIQGLIDLGGVEKVLLISWKFERLQMFDFSFDPTVRHTVWGLTIGSFFQWLAVYGTNQSQVQRYFSVPSVKVARRAIYYNLLGLWMILILTLSIGLVIFAKYQDCDPILNNEIKNSEQLFPLFVVQTLESTPGLPGLFLACLFSAALSTISSGLNSLAAVTLEDIIKGFIFKNLSEKRAAQLSKILCVVFGLLCLVVTYLVSFLGTLLQAALSLFGTIGGPILGVFILGLFVPFANAIGAIVGTLTSLTFTLWLFVGFNVYQIKYPKKPFFVYNCNRTVTQIPFELCGNYSEYAIYSDIPPKSNLEVFHSISYVWYGLIATLIVLIVGSITSILTGPSKPSQVNSKYVLSVFECLFPFMPLRVRKYMRFGYSYRNAHDESSKEKSKRGSKQSLDLALSVRLDSTPTESIELDGQYMKF